MRVIHTFMQRSGEAIKIILMMTIYYRFICFQKIDRRGLSVYCSIIGILGNIPRLVYVELIGKKKQSIFESYNIHQEQS